ncbi:hypothetical protein ACFW2V_13980 [Streptomyces sp. NPDC058947]|uniref:hypothetical protein n=1 Tax=Streptomyces sp. NPDC058947 TaxID=3346675 RepID=UPI0036B282F5
MPGVEWLRPEFKDREHELETREDFFKRTNITTQSLSSHFVRYANRVPKVVKKFGKQKYYLPNELDDFIEWIKENSGTRSESEIKRAEIARLLVAEEEAEARRVKHLESAAKAERDLARFRKQRRRAEDDLKFLEQGS